MNTMNKESAGSDAEKFGRDAKRKWSRLSDEQIENIHGDRTKLIEEIEDTYGLGREDALNQVRSWENEAQMNSSQDGARKDGVGKDVNRRADGSAKKTGDYVNRGEDSQNGGQRRDNR